MIVFEVSPALNVTVPDAATKSEPASAVPGPVAHCTVASAPAAWLSVIVSFTVVVPELPSVTVGVADRHLRRAGLVLVEAASRWCAPGRRRSVPRADPVSSAEPAVDDAPSCSRSRSASGRRRRR